MKNSLRMIQYPLYALLIFALSGCGASNSTTAGLDTARTGKITVLFPKSTAKTVASLALVDHVRLTVTGTTIPTASAVTPGTAGGTVTVYPGRHLTVTATALDVNDVVQFEGLIPNVTVDAGIPTTVSITLSDPVRYAKPETAPCLNCHDATRDTDGSNLVANYKQSGHYRNVLGNFPIVNGSTKTGCAGCHGTSHNDLHPADSGRCATCHSATPTPNHAAYTLGATTTCGNCHITHNFELAKAGCIGCHSIPQNAGAGFVQDNTGVRSIAEEFTKWSHHVTGVALNNAHCAACHLEGTIDSVSGLVVVDPTKHMINATTHLRNANDDSDFAWDPSAAAPNHTGMDNFCLNCHNASGAVSPMSRQIQTYINTTPGVAAVGKTASPLNPFGDTISNRYDKMQRPAVVDANSQFNVGNNSHHAVKGARYSGKSRTGASRVIASPATFNNNSSATLQGVRSTIYDAGNFNSLYAPLGTAVPPTAATELGDDSTLHCGDCHTVGQWKPGVATNAAGALNTVAIGAHGSNNEYLLRNTLGTDQRHTQNAFTLSAANVVTYTNPSGAFLVCYNCHTYTRYGSIYVGTGLNIGAGQQPHAGEYDAAGRCNGIGNTLPFNGYTTGKATDGTQFVSRLGVGTTANSATLGSVAIFANTPAFAPGFPLNSTKPAGEQNQEFGNIFGIQCNNCHNSGAGNAYGGIHGSANNTQTTPATVITGATAPAGGYYISGMGNATKVERFLPGLGDAMHSPGTLGGFTGGSAAIFQRFSSGVLLPVRDNTLVNTTTNKKVGSYTYTTGGVTNDTNWEQKHWQQVPGMIINNATGVISGATLTSQGAGCYTLGGATAAASALSGPSVTGATGPATALLNTWGGCEDHGAAQGGGDHGFVKRIVRPVTY